MRTVVKMIDNELCITIPANFVRPLKWKDNSTIDMEIVGNILQMSKI